MTGTDRVVFRDGTGGTMSMPWAGHWPPPDLLYLVQSPDKVTLVDPTRQSTGVIFRLITEHHATLYERTAYSLVPKPAGKDENWFRGARYQPRKVDSHEQDDGVSGDQGRPFDPGGEATPHPG